MLPRQPRGRHYPLTFCFLRPWGNAVGSDGISTSSITLWIRNETCLIIARAPLHTSRHQVFINFNNFCENVLHDRRGWIQRRVEQQKLQYLTTAVDSLKISFTQNSRSFSLFFVSFLTLPFSHVPFWVICRFLFTSQTRFSPKISGDGRSGLFPLLHDENFVRVEISSVCGRGARGRSES